MGTRDDHLSKIKDAYALKESIFKTSEAQLRDAFGHNSLALDTIDERTKTAWKQQWEPPIRLQREKALMEQGKPEDRYLEDTFYNRPPLHYYIPPKGFKDDFNMAAKIAHAGFFFPKRFDLSIWSGDTLCGVAFSALESRKQDGIVLIDITEGNPDTDHPLKGRIGSIIDKVSTNYAIALQCHKIAYRPPYSTAGLKFQERIHSKKERVMIPSTKHLDYSEECFVKHLL